jgi:hypothetical protein
MPSPKVEEEKSSKNSTSSSFRCLDLLILSLSLLFTILVAMFIVFHFESNGCTRANIEIMIAEQVDLRILEHSTRRQKRAVHEFKVQPNGEKLLKSSFDEMKLIFRST